MKSGLKTIISIVINICILGMQLTPGYSTSIANNKQSARVAYLGFHFDGIDKDKQSRINAQVLSLLNKEEQLYILSEKEVESRLDTDLLSRIQEKSNQEDLNYAAEILNVEYVFAGNLQNQSNSEDITVLVGSLVRYDKATDQQYELNIESFYNRFIEDLARIDQQLVQTILPERKKSFFARHLPGILIAAATIVAAAILLGNTGGQGSGGSGGQSPPFTVH